jgi:hypothetical protein
VLASKGEENLVATLSPDDIWGLVERSLRRNHGTKRQIQRHKKPLEKLPNPWTGLWGFLRRGKPDTNLMKKVTSVEEGEEDTHSCSSHAQVNLAVREDHHNTNDFKEVAMPHARISLSDEILL